MTKPNSAFTVDDIQGALTQIRHFIEVELGFDHIVTFEFSLQGKGKFQMNISAEDRFQKSREYSERIGKLGIWEPGESIDEILTETWKQLTHHMRRDERELRFGLAQLGDSIEGEGFQTAVGKMMWERLKKVRDEITGNLLPKVSREPEVERVQPTSGPRLKVVGELDDEIPF